MLLALGAIFAVLLSASGCGSSDTTQVSRGRLEPDAPRGSKIPFGYARPQPGLEAGTIEKVEATPTASAVTTEATASAVASGTIVSHAAFSAELAMTHVRYLADRVGVRAAGSAAERRAADYVVAQLVRLGYEPRIEDVPLPNGKTSRNVIAEKPGTSERTIVLGAHLDSKPPSPGANDDASGVGALLAIASALSDQRIAATVEFAFFGAEEIIGADVNQHHFGSRHRVSEMTAAEKSGVAGMISLDMIGYGDRLYARTMNRGPQSLVQDMIRYSRSRVPLTYLRDPAKTGQSDHEPYELGRIPAVWIESLPDPAYHKTTDTSSHVQPTRLKQVGQLVLDYVASRTDASLAALRR